MQSKSGFTIVELLIVILVIGILASVTVVAFNGVRNRATESVVMKDVKTNAGRIQRYTIETGGLPQTWPEMILPPTGTADKAHALTVSSRNHYSELVVVYYFNDAARGGWPGYDNSDGMVVISKIASTGKVFAVTTQSQSTRDITAEYVATGGTDIGAAFSQAYSAKRGGGYNMLPYVTANN